MRNRVFYALLLTLLFSSFAKGQTTYLHDRDTTYYTCGGIYADSGGVGGDYGNIENHTVTFCSDSTDCIQADFTAWQTEPFFDYMIIYDGPDDSYPELGRYSGSVSPGLQVSSTGCLTFRFITDSTDVFAGWEATLSCVQCPPGPCLPDMGICRDSVCNGDFFDSGGPTANYSNNDSLVHRICSNIGNCVQVDFNSFDLENGNDTLFIFEGDSIGGTLIGAYTGSNSPGTVASTVGCLTFLFVSNGSITGAGWDADITCTPCGPCLPNIGFCGDTVCSGNFYDTGGPGTGTGTRYALNEYFVHTICGDSGQCMSVDFTQFVTEEGFDFMNIYDGPSITAPLIATLTGDTLPPVYSATNGCLTFEWYSDFVVDGLGWAADLACIPCPCLPEMGNCLDNECFGQFFDPGGQTGNYAALDTFMHTICSDSGNCVQLDFTQFDLGAGDTLFVYDGPDDAGTLLGAYTGANSPGLVNSSNGCLTFVLEADGAGQGAGWEAFISCLNCGGCLPNMGTCLDSVCGGQFYDSGGPFANYGNSESNVHTICSPDPFKELQIRFNSFNIQPGFDLLRIYDGNSTGATLLGTFTGTVSPGTITSSNGCLTFEFTSNGSGTAPGWDASLNCVKLGCLPEMGNCLDSTCAGNFYDAGGSGNNYFNNESKVHTICGDSAGQCINVNFTYFETEPIVDFLQIFDGPSVSSPLIGTYSDTTNPGSITATTGCLTFKWITDGNQRLDGWEAGLSCSPCVENVCLPNIANCTDSICGSEFHDDGGEFGYYGNNLDLTHTICSDSGNNMQVEFTRFILEQNADSLYVYDGTSSSDPLLGAFTGATLPPVLTSSGGCLTFRFVTDSVRTYPGFDAVLRCVNSNCLPNIGNCLQNTCGGDFFDSGGDSATYGPNENLLHTICADPVGCLQVTFNSVALENGFDYLKIYDGTSTSDPLLAFIIATLNPGTITSTSGCLTFEFHSNDSVQLDGWDAFFSCVPCPGCVDPIAAFSADTTLLQVDFTDNSSGSGPLMWSWDFGDGNTSMLQNPSHTYAAAGDYVVCLYLQDSCGVDTLCDTITVACPGPAGNFTYTNVPFGANFTDATVGTNVQSWFWDFGDGNTDTTQNPAHTYAFPGTYTVCLTVGDACGTDTICLPVTITCSPPGAGFTETSTLLNASFTNTTTGTGTVTYLWDFGDGNTSTATNPTHHFASQGTYTVCLISSDTCGTDTFCTPVTISCPPPVAAFSASTSLFDATFTNASSGTNIFAYAWDFGDGNTSTATNPTHTYASNGTYTVCLIVSDSCAMDTLCQSVTINCPAPTAGFTFGTSLLGATFTDVSTGNSISSWQWDFGDGNTSTATNPTHIYAAPGSYSVCLIVSDVCATDTLCQTVTVSCPPPTAAFSHTSNLLGARFTDGSTGNFLNSWQWDFGDGNTSTAQNPTHTYAGPGTYTVCLIVSDSCGSDTACQVITISCPDPVASFGSSSTLLNANFTNTSSGNFISGYQWDFGDGNTSTATSPSHTYASAGTYTVCLIVSDSCGNDTVCNPITINCPPPVANFNSSSVFRNATFNDLSTGNSISGWQWDFGDGNTSTLQNPTHTYAGAGTYVVCLITTDICGSDTICKNVTINCPAPNAGFSFSTSLLGATFTNTSSGNFISGYQWNFGDGNTSTVTNPTHTYASPGTYTVCLVVNDTCASDTICQTVSISCPPPVAAFTHSSSLLNATFTDGSTGNFLNNWQWDFGDGNTSTLQNPTHTYASPGTYVVCVIVSDSCGADTACQNVTITCPDPVAGFSFTTNLLTANFTDGSSGTAINGWQWDFGDGNTSTAQNPSHNYATSGTYSVCLIVSDTCGTDTVCQNVTVLCPAPTSAFSFSTNFLNVTFTNSTSTTGTPSWQWDFGDGNTSTAQNPVHSYASAGTYLVCLITTDTCSADTFCQNVTVNICPPAVAGFTHTSSFLQASFTDTTTTTGSATWLWNFGDGNSSTQQNPMHNYAAPGTYTVCLSVTDLCGTSTICNPVTISCPPVTAGFSSSTSLFTANFTDLSAGSFLSGWQWDFGDGNTSTQQNPTHIYAAAGTYTVCLIVTDTCETDTVCQPVTITCPQPSASFSHTSSLLGATFMDLSSGISLNSWSWDFGDGNASSQQNPTHIYAAAGTYNVCLIVSDTCSSDTLCQSVTISCPPPTAAFSSTSSLLGASFTDLSSGNNLNSWRWNFGDGNTSLQQHPNHIYSSPGTYTVCLIVSDSCGSDTVCQPMTITCPPPTAAFNSSSSLLGATFTDLSSGNNLNFWSWNFGDGNNSNQQNPTHIYANPGTYTVCLIVRDSCFADTVCQNITISCPDPVAAFSSSSSLLGATFTDGSTGNNLSGWLWDFGDGNSSTQQNPTHVYAAAGTYTVCLTVLDSCGSDSVCQAVTITCPPPTAAFTSSSSLLGATFTDASSGTNLNGWLWDFGDGNSSTLQNPTHIYAAAGTYTVCLTVTDSCGTDSACQAVTITCPPPSAAFNSSSSLLGATFTDASTGTSLSSWLWDFGDGNSSTQQNPTHIYAGPGTYTVCLTVSDSCGTDSVCQTVTISCPPPTAAFSHSSSLLGANFTDLSSGNNVSNWLWDFGDGNSSTAQNPSHIYAAAGTYTVCLTVTDSCATDSVCQSITISCPPPNVDFSFTSTLLDAQFTDITTGNTLSSWLWDFGDGNSSTLQNPTHTYATGGSYTVCLTVSDSCGTDSICKTVVITCPNPAAGFTVITNLLGASFTNTSSTSTPGSYLWFFGDGNVDSVANPTHVYASPGTYTVCLQVTDTCGMDVFCQPVVISCPAPVVGFGFTTSFRNVDFTDNTTGNFITSWSWDFGDGNSSTQQNPSHQYATPGSYNVCLTVTDSCNSSTLCQLVTVVCPNPTALFSDSVSGLDIFLTDLSTGNSVSGWLWSFGDGNSSTLQNPSHTYAGPGNYSVCLTVTDTCGSNSNCQIVNITCPALSAGFTNTSTLLTATFTDFSTGSPTSWSWDFGDGNTSSQQNPTHTYATAGNYTVCLAVSDSCSNDTVCVPIIITCPLPTAGFTFTTTGLQADFTDVSTGTGVNAWNWDFGDGNTDVVQNPNHTYLMPGTYTVCLSSTDSCGVDSSCQSVTVDTLTALTGELSASRVRVYPNPFSGKIHLDFNLANAQEVEIEVLSVTGVRLQNAFRGTLFRETLTLELGGMTDGMYFLEIRVGNQRRIEKIQLIR